MLRKLDKNSFQLFKNTFTSTLSKALYSTSDSLEKSPRHLTRSAFENQIRSSLEKATQMPAEVKKALKTTTTHGFSPVINRAALNQTTTPPSFLLYRGTCRTQTKELNDFGCTVTPYGEGVTGELGSAELAKQLYQHAFNPAGISLTIDPDVALDFALTGEIILTFNALSIPKESCVTLKEAILAYKGLTEEELKEKHPQLPNQHEKEVTVRKSLTKTSLVSTIDLQHLLEIFNSEHICQETALSSGRAEVVNAYIKSRAYFQEAVAAELQKEPSERNQLVLDKSKELLASCLHFYLRYINDLKLHPEEQRALIHAHVQKLEASKPVTSFHMGTGNRSFSSASSAHTLFQAPKNHRVLKQATLENQMQKEGKQGQRAQQQTRRF